MVQVATKSCPRPKVNHQSLLMCTTALVLGLYLLLAWQTSLFTIYSSPLLLNLTVSDGTAFQEPAVVSTKQNELRSHKQSTRVLLTAMLGPNYQEKAQKWGPSIKKRNAREFDNVFVYEDFPDFILNNPQWKPHLEFLQKPDSPSRRGAGYWFWKPVLIDHHLSHLETGDLLLYSDADWVYYGLPDISELLDFMMQHHADLALYQIPETERQYNKHDVYVHFCPDRDQEKDLSRSYDAGWQVIIKTPGTVQFYQDWMKGVSNFHFINDEPSKLPNIRQFSEHRHDQSVLNLLLKCRYHEPDSQKYPEKVANADVMTFQFRTRH